MLMVCRLTAVGTPTTQPFCQGGPRSVNEKTTIMLCGRSGAGKTTQLGLLAEYVYREHKKKTRIYVADPGGIGPILPYVDAGIIEPVYIGSTNPWVFLSCAVKGMARDASGKWVVDHPEDIGCYLFESASAFGEAVKGELAQQAALGNNVGGSTMVNFTRSDEGIDVSVGGNNLAHYGVGQEFISQAIIESFRLPAHVIGWTTRLSKQTDDGSSVATISGPEILGKAKTADVPAWFMFTFRVDVVPGERRGTREIPEKHLLYLGQHRDEHTIGKPLALGNARVPLDADAPQMVIDPANIIVALDQMKDLKAQAVGRIRERLGL